jgi:hypothetical protein
LNTRILIKIQSQHTPSFQNSLLYLPTKSCRFPAFHSLPLIFPVQFLFSRKKKSFLIYMTIKYQISSLCIYRYVSQLIVEQKIETPPCLEQQGPSLGEFL